MKKLTAIIGLMSVLCVGSLCLFSVPVSSPLVVPPSISDFAKFDSVRECREKRPELNPARAAL